MYIYMYIYMYSLLGRVGLSTTSNKVVQPESEAVVLAVA